MTGTSWLVLMLLIPIIVVGFPFLILLSSKLAAYGWLRGKELFEKERLNCDAEPKSQETKA